MDNRLEATRTWICRSCSLTFVGERPEFACPVCAGLFEPEGRRSNPHEETFSFTIPFSVYQCDNESCEEAFFLDVDHLCPRCGHAVLIEEDSSTRRLDALGGRLNELHLRTESWRNSQVEFATRGPRSQLAVYGEWLSDCMQKALATLEDVKVLLAVGEWDEPHESQASETLDSLIDRIEESRTLAETLASTAPPLTVLAVHRQTTRTLHEMTAAIIEFVLVLNEPYRSTALAKRDLGQRRFDEGAAKINHVNVLLDRIQRVIFDPGFWAVDDHYDTGRIAWEGIDEEVSSVADAAQVVRETFGKVPGIAALPDEEAFMLLPGAAIGASLQDPERLVARAIAARAILDEADRRHPGWIDSIVLLELVWLGHRQLVDQVVRLGHALRTDMPRTLLMHTSLDVFSKFLEGPLRTLGLVIAGAVSADGVCRLDRATGKPPLSEIAGTLGTASSVLLDGVDQLIRHGEAHYDYALSDDGIEIRHVPRAGAPASDFYSDDDFFEQLVNLNEALVAIELAVIPYLYSRPEPEIVVELERRSQAIEVRYETLRALAGLKGWTDLRFENDDVSVLRVSGEYRGPNVARAVEDLLPVVAAAWDLFPSVQIVCAIAPHTGSAVDIRRNEFAGSGVASQIRQHKVVLLVNRLRREQSGIEPTFQAERDLLYSAALIGTVAIANLLREENEANDNLSEYAAWLGPRLQRVDDNEPISQLAAKIHAVFERIARALTALRVSRARLDTRFAHRATADLRACMEALVKLAEECREASGIRPDEPLI